MRRTSRRLRSTWLPLFPRSSCARNGKFHFPYFASQADGRSMRVRRSCWLRFGKHGLAAWVQPFADVASVKNFKIDALDARLVCVSYFGAQATPTHMRYLIRRLKRLMPHARFLAGFWMLGNEATKLEEWRTIVGADFACGTLVEATTICVREAMQGQDRKACQPRELYLFAQVWPPRSPSFLGDAGRVLSLKGLRHFGFALRTLVGLLPLL